MNSPTDLYTLEHVGDLIDWSFVNRVAGLNLSEAEESINIVMGFKDRAYVYGAASVDYSRIGTGLVRDADLRARRSEKLEVNHDYEGLNMVETVKEVIEELVEVENGIIDNMVDHIVLDETDVIDNEMLIKKEDNSHLQETLQSKKLHKMKC
uniref:Uncharacterized protein n=1 Tax=Tanacetum cinerariifolium TaxID=118510 RepID=A0A6L2KD41_TANCI|nr:hypothetical protein [Tanacetum cinerariifolium]